MKDRPPQISAMYTDSRGDFHYIIPGGTGRCGTCKKDAAVFINRNGVTRCCDCDLEEGKRIAGRKLRGVSA